MAKRQGNKQNNLANQVSTLLGRLTVKSPRNKMPTKKTKAKQRQGKKSMGPVSMNQTVVNVSGMHPCRYVQSDHVGTVNFNTLDDGKLVFLFRVDPSMFKSMSKIASAFQRITWNSITFSLSSRMPTSSSGGYVMGFRPDASDNHPPSDIEELKQYVNSSPHAVSNNIWKSYTMRIGPRELTKRLLYTSPGDDPREFSPGMLFVVVDGGVNQAGALSLTVQYDVTFSTPSYEAEQVDDGPSEYTNQVKMYLYDGETTPRSGDSSGSAVLTFAQIFGTPPPQDTIRLQMDGVTFGGTQTGDAGEDIETCNGFVSVIAQNFFAYTNGSSELAQPVTFKSPTGNTQIIPAGTLFKVTGTSTPGNYLRPQKLRLKWGRVHSSTNGCLTNLNY